MANEKAAATNATKTVKAKRERKPKVETTNDVLVKFAKNLTPTEAEYTLDYLKGNLKVDETTNDTFVGRIANGVAAKLV